MALGAAATGARAATGSTGQGIALMQETIAEAALNELPLVVFNMARGQQDYFQTTRGGGWGDYRTIALAPASVVEAAEHTRLAFELADRWLTPVVLYGDHMIGFTQTTVEAEPAHDDATVPDKPWALDGSSGGTGASKVVWTWRQGKHNTPGPGPNRHWQHVADKYDQIAATEARHAGRHVDDASTSSCRSAPPARSSTTSWTSSGVEGHRIGTFRPVTLWPFPSAALGDLARCGVVPPGAGPRAQRGADDRRRPPRGERRGAGARGRRREPGRVGHASGRAARRRHHPRAHPRRHRRSTTMTNTDPTMRKVADFAPDLFQSTEHHLCSGLRPPGRLAVAGRGARGAQLVDRSIGVVGSRLLHPDHHHRRRRVPAVPARPRPGGRHRHEAHAPGSRDLHPAGRRRHGLGRARRGPAHGRAWRVDHLPHARQRRVRRHRRADDRGDDRRATHQDEPRRSLRAGARLPDPGRRHRGHVPRRRRTSRAARSTSPTPSRGPGATSARRSRSQLAGEGFSLVEILTMCPTGWAVPTDQGAQYQRDQVESTFGLGELRPRSTT